MKYKPRFETTYTPYFKLCDNILKHLINSKMEDSELSKKDFLGESDNEVDACYRTLEHDGYIIRLDSPRGLKITAEGIAFRILGGYEYKIKHEDHLGWLSEKQMETTIDLNRQLRWTNFWNFIFIALSTIFIAGTFFNDLKCNKTLVNIPAPKIKNDTSIVVK